MKPKILEIYDDAPMCPLDMLWLVNSFSDGGDTKFSSKLISLLVNAEIPLYYFDQRLDSNTAFSEYRLTEAENENAYMHINCAEFEESEAVMRPTCAEYFANSIRNSSSLTSDAVPFWFGARATLGFERHHNDGSSSQEKIASLFVKLMDVKSKCQLQGISGFYWPIQYPIIRHDNYVVYKLENGLWKSTKVSQPETYSTGADQKDELFERRVACVLQVLHVKKYVLSNGVWNPDCAKFPRSQIIYEWVRNDPSFCINGQVGRDSIFDSTFNQLWKERLRVAVQKRIGYTRKKR